MNLGYDKALYLLPFDHRQSYVSDMFHLDPPLDATQLAQVIDSKQLIHEGFDLAAAFDRFAPRRGGREQVGCIVLGRGADEARVRAWLTVAAGVPGFIGFAVGRTSFWDAVSGCRAQTLTRADAATQIAGRLREWVDVFEAGRSSQPTGTA